MSILAQNHTDEVALLDCIQKFFAKHHVGKLLKQCNGTKEKGVPSISLLKYKLGNIFIGRSMYMQQRTGSFKEDFSKNTFYRFLNSAKTNWLRFTSLLAADIVNNGIKDLTDASRKNVFIIDDSLFSRTSCKKTELGSKVFDHTGMNYKKGYRMLTLLDTAVSAGLSAEYVLFNSWFSNPAQITAIKRKGMDVIAMIKKSSRIKYTYNDEQLNIKEIYSKNKKRRGSSK